MQENASCIMEGVKGRSHRQLVPVLIIRFFYGATVGQGFTITLRHITFGKLLWTSDQTVAETST
jgi:hypothetical protein